MSSLMHAFFGTELTYIPSGMQKLLGPNFNNALCNGITWLVIFWLTLHFAYDRLISIYLKQLGFSQYLRVRLSHSLWLLACYFSFCIYYVITINEYNTGDLMYYRRTIAIHYGVISDRQKIGQAVICSFYLCMAYREGTQMGYCHFFKHVALTIACTTAFILRFLEIPFTITALIAVSGIFQELSKMFYSLLNKDNIICNVVIGSLYISAVIIFCAVYFTIIPLSYLIPMGMKLFSRERNPVILTLFLSLLCWINLLIYKSIFLNAIFHWLYHIKEDKHDEKEKETRPIQLECHGNIVECSLFPPRTDESFMLALMRSEARKRQRKMIALRKPKNRTFMIQTIKCMMTLHKTLSKKKSTSAANTQEKVTSASQILEKQQATDNKEERFLLPVKKTQKMFKLSEEETLMKVENLETQDNAEEEESEIKTVEANNRDEESCGRGIIEDSPSKEKPTQIMQSAMGKDSQATQLNVDENISSIRKCPAKKKCIQIKLDRAAATEGPRNVACLCRQLTKDKDEGEGNGKN
ncbi:unnamed protein product [Ceutorhynchus assimilis]|uniref:Uncharacterized protein n=1 Tax=Ceutorhynchus assimilis TaxID=467358 RepID=A0A9N9MY32_9CUCU|nr:unnamed protein product [Ceutorhynchus assimilis]